MRCPHPSQSGYLDAATQQNRRARRLGRPRRGGGGRCRARATNAGRLEAAGVSIDQVATFCGAVAGTPGAFAAIRAEITPQNPMAEASPMAHALRMFVSYLFAGAAPVVPFALPPLEEERILSVVVTIALLLALGVGRWLVAGRKVLRTALEAMFVAAAAAAAGAVIGRLVA